MAFTMCTSQAIISKAGYYVNSTIAASGAYISQLSDEAESYVNTECGINYTDTYSTLNADVKYVLQEAVSCHAAAYLAAYDLDGYTNASAQTLLDVLSDKERKAIELLKLKAKTDFITRGT